jgi:hypothetical protein
MLQNVQSRKVSTDFQDGHELNLSSIQLKDILHYV